VRQTRRCCIPRTTITWALIRMARATTFTTALRTTEPAAAFCWKWRGPLRNRPVPPHAVYFAAVTAEEQGLLGSQFLGMHPPVPAGQISLDLNYDMLLPIGIPRSVSLGGAERIDFWPTVQTVAKAFDLALLPDPTPGAGHYYRSDHFSLARVGIPAFSVDQGELFEGHTPSGDMRRLRTTLRTTTISLPTSTGRTGIFAGMPRWRGLGWCWDGWRVGRRGRWSGCRGTSLNAPEKPARATQDGSEGSRGVFS
jgi:hypothetical protein